MPMLQVSAVTHIDAKNSGEEAWAQCLNGSQPEAGGKKKLVR